MLSHCLIPKLRAIVNWNDLICDSCVCRTRTRAAVVLSFAFACNKWRHCFSLFACDSPLPTISTQLHNNLPSEKGKVFETSKTNAINLFFWRISDLFRASTKWNFRDMLGWFNRNVKFAFRQTQRCRRWCECIVQSVWQGSGLECGCIQQTWCRREQIEIPKWLRKIVGWNESMSMGGRRSIFVRKCAVNEICKHSLSMRIYILIFLSH